jgi:hypothetical protein
MLASDLLWIGLPSSRQDPMPQVERDGGWTKDHWYADLYLHDVKKD